jgi:hypothetical protein
MLAEIVVLSGEDSTMGEYVALPPRWCHSKNADRLSCKMNHVIMIRIAIP